MPKKVRELKAILLSAGFVYESAKGSHTKWSHPLINGKLTLSGKDGAMPSPIKPRILTPP
jgi:predicted RNA binding protein YcfA (HicA-like mRNA interferase family)